MVQALQEKRVGQQTSNPKNIEGSKVSRSKWLTAMRPELLWFIPSGVDENHPFSVVGRRGNYQKQTLMEKQNLTEEQRKLFTRMLTQAHERAQAGLETYLDLSQRITSKVVPELAKKIGVLKLVVKIRNLRKQVRDFEKALDRLGFECDKDDISLRYQAPKALRKVVDTAIESAEKERNSGLRKYDVAMLNLVAAASVEDAKKFVQDLI